jgi:amino acid adenylation domain-containing protein
VNDHLDVRRPHLLHERFDLVAVAAPDRVALDTADRAVTYGEVKARADRLAARLRAAGAGPEQVVGIHLERSAEAIIALLAVLKAGAAYAPLPVDHPADRLRFMAADAGIRIVVTGPEPVTRFSLAGIRTISAEDRPRTEPDTGPVVPAVHSANMAYVLYTSGSTGTPKGVAVTHASAVNMVDPRQNYIRFGPDQVFLQLSPLAFDISALEIWGSLANGATLVVAAPSYQAIDELPAVLAEKRVTTLVLTPALFHALMDTRPAALDGVRQLIVGGDAMSPRRAHAFVERAARRGVHHTLINGYGPTEATTLVSTHPMAEVFADAPRVPLGHAIEGAAVHLLNEDLQPVEHGERGQVYIGGKALARGYLHRPGLTGSRFVPDPFAGRRGARMYATGDEGVCSDSGLIEFVGRLDDQVKIRGYRVELGEVEQVLRSHPGVREACVVPVKSREQTEQLVGFVVPRVPGRNDLTEALTSHIRASLPDYMRPSRVVSRAGLPLTATGKIDRRSLGQLAAADPATADRPAQRGSLTPDEAALAEIWQGVLEVDEIGPDDDFFDLGGTSLLAIRIVAEAEYRGLHLSLARLFKNKTLRNVCATMARSAAAVEIPAGKVKSQV